LHPLAFDLIPIHRELLKETNEVGSSRPGSMSHRINVPGWWKFQKRGYFQGMMAGTGGGSPVIERIRVTWVARLVTL
jgi:hypothetical protein